MSETLGRTAGTPRHAAPGTPLQALVPLAARVCLASILFLGLLHALFGENLARMMPAWPAGMPGRPWWAHAAGVVIAGVAGMGLMRRANRGVAVLLGVLLVVPVLALHLPRALPTGTFGDAWLNVMKWLAMAAGPFLVAALAPVATAVPWRDRAVAAGAALAPWLMGAFMIGSAVLHVRHAEFVAQLMQPWMPWRLFWTYFAAVALAAGGIGLVVPRTQQSAALLTSVMIFSWFLLVHVPRTLLAPTSPIGWSEIGESLGFSAMAVLLAVRVRPGGRHGPGG